MGGVFNLLLLHNVHIISYLAGLVYRANFTDKSESWLLEISVLQYSSGQYTIQIWGNVLLSPSCIMYAV